MMEKINIISMSMKQFSFTRTAISEQNFRALKRSSATMRIAMPKSFDGLTKIKIQIEKIDVCKIVNNFVSKKESRKEQFVLL